LIPHSRLLLLSVTAVAVLGIALIAMGEDIGTDMSFRTFGHLVSHLILIIIVCILSYSQQNLLEAILVVHVHLYHVTLYTNLFVKVKTRNYCTVILRNLTVMD